MDNSDSDDDDNIKLIDESEAASMLSLKVPVKPPTAVSEPYWPEPVAADRQVEPPASPEVSFFPRVQRTAVDRWHSMICSFWWATLLTL